MIVYKKPVSFTDSLEQSLERRCIFCPARMFHEGNSLVVLDVYHGLVVRKHTIFVPCYAHLLRTCIRFNQLCY